MFCFTVALAVPSNPAALLRRETEQGSVAAASKDQKRKSIGLNHTVQRSDPMALADTQSVGSMEEENARLKEENARLKQDLVNTRLKQDALETEVDDLDANSSEKAPKRGKTSQNASAGQDLLASIDKALEQIMAVDDPDAQSETSANTSSGSSGDRSKKAKPARRPCPCPCPSPLKQGGKGGKGREKTSALSDLKSLDEEEQIKLAKKNNLDVAGLEKLLKDADDLDSEDDCEFK
jgi:regulator of replication initiation timing